MNKRIYIWISVVASLALATVFLLAVGAAARPLMPVTPATQPHAVAASSSWNSGWVTVSAHTCQVFNHNLGTAPEDYALSLLFWDTDGNLGLNRRNYGGLEYGGNWYGVYWEHLTANTISICRLANDNGADKINIRLWVPDSTPDYDSGWTDIAAGGTVSFSHNLGITATELSVSLWFSGTSKGIHHYGYGGLSVDAPPTLRGAYWHNLTTNTVQVSRRVGDTDIEQVRVVVVHSDPPDYDSGWQPISAGTVITLNHNLNQSPVSMLMRAECYSSTIGGPGIHQWFSGGDYSSFGGWQGTNMQNLTANTVQIVRRADDLACPLVRVRIWVPEHKIYLPLVLNNYAPEVELAYDDGTMETTDSWDTGKGFAVCFSPPDGSAQILRANYYLQAPYPIEVHVWDAATHADLLSEQASPLPGQDGWNYVDLSYRNLTVTADFCVGFLHIANYQPTLGVDTGGSGHSYEIDGDYWELQSSNYMIRAVVVSQ